MTAIKRVEDVLLASAACARAASTRRCCLVGDGPDRESIERRAHELGIARHVLSVGYQRDVAPYYAFMDALLLPSANEGTPVVAIESLAARTAGRRDAGRRRAGRGRRRRGRLPRARSAT